MMSEQRERRELGRWSIIQFQLSNADADADADATHAGSMQKQGGGTSSRDTEKQRDAYPRNWTWRHLMTSHYHRRHHQGWAETKKGGGDDCNHDRRREMER